MRVEWTTGMEKQPHRERYKMAKEANLVVVTTKTIASKCLYVELENKGAEKKLHWLAKSRERRARNLDQVKCIKDMENKVWVEDALIGQRWQLNFHKLFNKEWDRDIVLGELEHSRRCQGYYRCIKVEKVWSAILRMHGGGAIWPDEILVEFQKSTGTTGMEWLTWLFNVVFETTKMLEEWRWSSLIPLYKNKGDI